MARRVNIVKVGAGRARIELFDSATPAKKNVWVPGQCELRIDEGNPGAMVIQPLNNTRIDPIVVQFADLVTDLGATTIEEYLIELANGQYFE